ncbi:MAG: DUF5689 domain-containing protein [Chitinophagales bacterium]|nr:DUF5689 domain-containing protein [Chitinophagales bacterium]MDW8419165.1 DUF5689 domain-containing protein [Chitinophagales bacterium]
MKKTFLYLTSLLFISGVSSCIKEKYDEPPANGVDPDITVNFTIDSVKARSGGQNYQFQEELVISGVVVANDQSGNFYQNIIIQDSTGGISVRIDRTNLYTDYPVGRRVFIKLKGLWVGTFAGLYQLGGYINEANSVQPIPSSLVDRYILKGVWGLPVVPKAVTISQLNNSYQNTLIELNGVEFALTDVNKPYADGYNKNSVNRTLKDCSGGSIIVRTSGYAKFANSLTPTGNGKLIAVYSVFNNTGQLIIRDLNDVRLDSTRCGGTINPGNGILGIRQLYSGSDVVMPAGKKISGVVISDNENANFDPKNMAIQDSTGGIVVRFTANHNFSLGDLVEVDVSGLTLTTYNGLLEFINTPASACVKIGTGTVQPRIATVAEVLANADTWESTLITIQNASISGSGTTWSGTKQITDLTGSINHYTRSQATFSSTALPSGNKSFTGILGDFNGPQLQIRSLSDVQ